jgi:hypothetical protein
VDIKATATSLSDFSLCRRKRGKPA